MKKYIKILFSAVLFLCSFLIYAQENEEQRLNNIAQDLDSLAISSIPNLNTKVEFSLSNVNLQVFLRALGKEAGVNLAIEENLAIVFSPNFNDAKVRDVLLFLCNQYQLAIEVIGNIISIYAYEIPPEPEAIETPKPPKVPEISISSMGKISFNLKRDTLLNVLNKITAITDVNFAPNKSVQNRLISASAKDMLLIDAVKLIGESNGVHFSMDENRFYTVIDLADLPKPKEEKKVEPVVEDNRRGKRKRKGNNFEKNESSELYVEAKLDNEGNKKVSIDAVDATIEDVLNAVSTEMEIDYFMYNIPEGTITLYIEEVDYPTFLQYLLKDRNYNYHKEGATYFLSDTQNESFGETVVMPINYRSVKDIITFIPKDLSSKVEIIDSPELNSLIVSGHPKHINDLNTFIKAIDKVIPMVFIEVIIIDVNDTNGFSSGLTVGVGDNTVQTSGTVFPGVDLTLGSNTLNGIISAINGLGVVNLGFVPNNFYASLQFIENQNYIDIRSTPKLSTLNGHEAKLSIGQTQYYIQTRTDIIGSQNPQTFNSQEFVETSADLSIDITPFVSGDEQITLDVAVNMSSFLGSGDLTLPPPKTNRTFNSKVRVMNGEMVVLGGLEEIEHTETGTGTPFLSRIPIIKWFFSSRNKTDSKRKSIVFIRPTIIY